MAKRQPIGFFFLSFFNADTSEVGIAGSVVAGSIEINNGAFYDDLVVVNDLQNATRYCFTAVY